MSASTTANKSKTDKPELQAPYTRSKSTKNGAALLFFFFQAEDAIRAFHVTGVQTCALPISPMRARFGLVERLSYYPPDDLAQILGRSAGILGVPADAAGIAEIARRSRGTPRVANRLLKRVRDYAQVRAGGKITAPVAAEALKRLDVDEFGLDDMDGRILKTIIEQFEGGPVGLTTIAAAVGEDPGTLEEVYEPFLMQQGFLARTP